MPVSTSMMRGMRRSCPKATSGEARSPLSELRRPVPDEGDRPDPVRHDDHVLAGQSGHRRRPLGAGNRPGPRPVSPRHELLPERRRRDRLARSWTGAPPARSVRIERVQHDRPGHPEVRCLARIRRRLETAHHPGVAPGPDEQSDGLGRSSGSTSRPGAALLPACRSPTSRYGPAPSWFSPADQPRTLAPFALAKPSRVGPDRSRASFCRRSCVVAVRSSRRAHDVEHHLHARADALDEVRLGDEVAAAWRGRAGRRPTAAAATGRGRGAGRANAEDGAPRPISAAKAIARRVRVAR